MGICTNRTIIVTGSGSGLGRQYALALAAESANVVVNDINRAGAESVVDEIVKAGGKAVASVDDITSMSGDQAIVDAGVNAFGDVHGVVHNAGVVRDRMFASMTEDERSEEHTSELQSLMRISYAVFCLKKQKNITKKLHLTLLLKYT